MFTSKQLLDLLVDQPGSPGFRGRVEAIKRYALRPATHGGRGQSINHDRLIADLEAMPPAAPAEKYLHPADDAKRTSPLLRDAATGAGYQLTPADIAWIQRLPADPAQVSYDDAVHLAALANASSRTTDPGGHRLIQSVWAPVKEVHDARAAEVTLRNAQAPRPDLPASARAALADAVAAESPELHPDEAATRASRMLDEALAKRREARDEAVMDARAAIAQAREAAAVRTRVVKEPEPSRR
jgi:hypothetical protein